MCNSKNNERILHYKDERPTLKIVVGSIQGICQIRWWEVGSLENS
jgi:hypothetical protein